MERILVIGANGQIGSELVEALAEKHGADNVIAADIAPRSLVGARRYLSLDVLDGELDGTPPLPSRWQRAWARDFQRAYDAFCAEVDAARETAIDPYAAEAPEEFFAVATEYHFSAPWLLEAAMPEVAAHLARFYGPAPLQRQPS